MRSVSLILALYAFWLALSGHYVSFLMTAGFLCALLCYWVARRMAIVDTEGQPTQLYLPFISYFPWIVWEIVKSCWAVTKIIVDPRLPISPTMTRVRATQRTGAGIATYGNSITLTPGTITTDIKGNILTVHALVKDGALDLEGGGMDARVTEFEGRPA